MKISPLVDQLIDAFKVLPGVGPKTAQRMVLYLLQKDRDGGRELADSLKAALDSVGQCRSCRALSEKAVCDICENPARHSGVICVVENPVDQLAIEQLGVFRGMYFVLMGHLSPIDGMGPDEIGADHLLSRVEREGVEEVIVATNSTVEGEATAHYISEMLRPLGTKVSRIAHGIPFGGELEYVDGGTLAHAIDDRRPI